MTQSIGVARHREARAFDRAIAERDPDDRAHDLAVLAAGGAWRQLDAQAVGVGRAHHHGVAPGDACDRLRQLLQPGVVAEPAVVHGRIRLEHDFEPGGRRRQIRRRRDDLRHADGRGHRRARRPRNHAVVQPAPPFAFAGVAGFGETAFGRPALVDGVVPRPLGCVGERGDDFESRLAVVERLDERLHDGRGAVVRPLVAPRLEVVRLGNLPVAARGRLAGDEAQVHAQRHGVHRLVERDIRGRRVHGIAAEDEERVDESGAHRLGKRAQ